MPYSDDKLIKLKSELRDKIKPVFNNLNSFDEIAILMILNCMDGVKNY